MLKRTLIVIMSALLIVAGTAVAASAIGGASVFLSASSTGTAGVAQTLTATVTTTGGVDPTGTSMTFEANGAVVGTVPLTLTGGVWGASFRWSPSASGNTTVAAYWSGTQSNIVNVAVSPVGTRTSITAPSYAETGTWVPVTVTVTATSGTIVPTGNVSLTAAGGFSQTATLSPGAGSTATATLNYFAGIPSTVTLSASYVPSNSATSASTATDTIAVGGGSVPVVLSVPSIVTVGVPTSMTLTSNATKTGYATVTANGVVIVNQQYFTGGQLVIPVTPKTAGTFSLSATVTAPNGVQYSTTDSAVATVASEADTITLVINGYGPLSTTTPFNAANGSVFGLTPSAASGAAVSVTTSGPCVQNQAVLTIPTGSGSCTLTATSPGGNGRGPATAKYPITLMPGPQTAENVNPKASGKYSAGSTITLASTSAKTNANQPIKWKVTSGSSYCTIKKADGKYKVKLTSTKGKTCQIQGSSPAVKGEWNAYSITRKYTTK